MTHLYECSEPNCEILVEGIFCRWHHRKLRNPAKSESPVAQHKNNVTSSFGDCFYCGDYEALTRDHVIPKALGRQFRRPWNVVMCCEFCNRKKANLHLADWLRKISAARGSGKYSRILGRSTTFITHLLTNPSHAEIRRYRSFIDPWWGDDPKAPIIKPEDRLAARLGKPKG